MYGNEIRVSNFYQQNSEVGPTEVR